MTTTIRKPSLTVTHNAAPLTDVMAARVQLGFNLRVAEATVVLRALPAGIIPWDDIVITMGATVGTAAVRFTGFFLSADNTLYPKETTLHCRGKLALADIFEAQTNVDMTGYNPSPPPPSNPGFPDETMVSDVLYICGLGGGWTPGDIPDYMASIGGTGNILGHYAWAWGFEWEKGEAALRYIERLDEVCLGYRTYDTFDGTVTRTQITARPTGAATATFTEHVDIFRATETTTIENMRNRVVVSGWPGQDNKTEIEYTAEAGNPYLLYWSDDTQQFLTEHLSSNMIEFETDADKVPTYGLSCEEVAKWKLAELNEYRQKVVMTTPRDTVIAPGDTIAINAPTRLGFSTRKFWVQEVDVEINRAGAFSQVLTCITGIPIYQAYVAPVVVEVTIPAVAATMTGTGVVAPVVVTVTIPAVTATYVYAVSAAVAPVVVQVTIPAVAATMTASAAVAPVVVNVTIPAVTATSV